MHNIKSYFRISISEKLHIVSIILFCSLLFEDNKLFDYLISVEI